MKVGFFALCSLAKAEVKYDSSYFDTLLEDIYATQMQNRDSAADYAEKLEREIKYALNFIYIRSKIESRFLISINFRFS